MAKIQVGEDVWYRARANEAGPFPGEAPLAAIVTAIDGERVNLFVFSKVATTHAVLNVPYLEKGSIASAGYAQPIGGTHVEPDAAEPLEDDATLGAVIDGEAQKSKKKFFGGKDK